ncbi:MAG TPA: hypothetical protein PKY30_25255, partial [Myxococcota bacterium]|nr:hypothetical protein [Myxococcota bacterium]
MSNEVMSVSGGERPEASVGVRKLSARGKRMRGAARAPTVGGGSSLAEVEEKNRKAFLAQLRRENLARQKLEKYATELGGGRQPVAK